MVRVPVVSRVKGLAIDPISPAAFKVRDEAVIAVPVRVVRIAPTCAVRMRLVPVRVIGEVILISPVVWVRERDEAVMIAAL